MIYISQSCVISFYCLPLTSYTQDKPNKRFLCTSPGVKQDQLLDGPSDRRCALGLTNCLGLEGTQRLCLQMPLCLAGFQQRKKKWCHTPSDSLKSISDTLDTLQKKAAGFAIAKQRFATLIMSWKHCYGSKALKKEHPGT